MWNYIPGLGWVLDLFFKFSLAVPFYIIWTLFGVGTKFFYFLPVVYQVPGFWECVGVFIVVPILKLIFVPTIVSVTQTNNSK